MRYLFYGKMGDILVTAMPSEEETHDVGEVFGEFIECGRWDVKTMTKETGEEDDKDDDLVDVAIEES